MKYIRGFLMAWGNFSALPCPCPRWHEDSRKAMICMLPLVGLMLSLVVMAAWWVLDLIGTPSVLTGALLTAVYFLAAGFIHLDGFMDCSDAILSRRPEQAERQRILKDSAVGAFAVICTVLMFLVFAASMITLAGAFSIWKGCCFVGVVIASRSIAADAVLWKPAMQTSQYASFDREKGGRRMEEVAALWIITLIPLLLIFAMMLLSGQAGSEELSYSMTVYVGAVMATAAAAHITGRRDRKNLGGMSGDIAGHMIVMGETMGVLAAALLASWVS